MHRISVPLPLSSGIIKRDREKVHQDLQAIGATRVFIADGQYRVDTEKRRLGFSQMKENIDYFRALGYEVGIWIWTFWASGKLPYTEITSLEGKSAPLFYCPMDAGFRAFASDYVAEIAALGPDIIMYDDDFRFGHLGNGVNCFCEHHVKEISRLLGEEVDREVLAREVFRDGKNRYRDAWMQAKATSMRLFADDVRAAVDRVNPSVRLGYCSCISNWGCEGVSAIELSRRLAGKTKPFMRLSGAPYWAAQGAWGNRLQNVIEVNRSEIAQCRDAGIEIFSEGDVYPRPRYKVAAAYLEGMDLALRFTGGTDGMLKYVHDYTSRITYERGYVERHVANAGLYEDIVKQFSSGVCEGVRVYDRAEKIADKIFYGENPSHVIDHMLFNPAARALADGSIPTTYEGEGICGIAFGEDVLDVPRNVYKNGLILDLTAAEILESRGVDVGLVSSQDVADQGVELLVANYEYFREEDNCVHADYALRSLALKEGAEVDSDYLYGSVDAQKRTPASYFYENAEGERFFVLGHRAYFNSEGTYRGYARARQLRRAVERLSGRRLPAFVDANPDVYLITKRCEDGALSVALFNFSLDVLVAPTVQLDRAYTSVSATKCDARLDGASVHLSDVMPFGCAFLKLVL